jgi:signal transduction histidine kinase
MFKSLNSRLLLSYVLIILVCLVLVGMGLLLFLRASPIWASAAALRLEAAMRAVAPALQRATPKQLPTILAQAAEEQEVRTLLLDQAGTILFDSGGNWTGERLEQVTRSPAARGRVRGTFTAPTGATWTFAGQLISAPGGTPHVAAFVSPQGRLLMLATFVENLTPPLGRAGAVALVLSILLALLVSRSVGAPLRRVAGAAEAIARGETDARAPVSGPAEVQALARSFNTMADRVEATRQSQRDFVANISHELKTPLTSIQGFAQALLDGTAQTPDATTRAAHVIHEEADRMRRMVDELLTLARLDAGQLVMAQDLVEIGQLLRRSAEKLAPQARAAEITLETDAEGKLFVSGDADRLAQVLDNLLDNGIAHTPAGGTVTMTARAQGKGQTVEVTVADTGEGIPAEALPRIFERFYQVDRSRRRSRGAGLGLSISKEIVQAHGGTIRAESVVGQGTRFVVRLPARRGGAETTVVGRRKSASSSAGGRARLHDPFREWTLLPPSPLPPAASARSFLRPRNPLSSPDGGRGEGAWARAAACQYPFRG